MFEHFRVERHKKKHPQVDPELVDAGATFLMKLIGLTVKGRVLRAVLAAGVAGSTAYLSPSQEPPLPSSEPQPVPMVSLPPEQAAMPPDTTCSAGRLDWQGTATGH